MVAWWCLPSKETQGRKLGPDVVNELGAPREPRDYFLDYGVSPLLDFGRSPILNRV